MPKTHQHREQEQKVAVVYYLSRNGELDHPHFIEVPLSSPQGLYLKGNVQCFHGIQLEDRDNLSQNCRNLLLKIDFCYQML